MGESGTLDSKSWSILFRAGLVSITGGFSTAFCWAGLGAGASSTLVYFLGSSFFGYSFFGSYFFGCFYTSSFLTSSFLTSSFFGSAALTTSFTGLDFAWLLTFVSSFFSTYRIPEDVLLNDFSLSFDFLLSLTRASFYSPFSVYFFPLVVCLWGSSSSRGRYFISFFLSLWIFFTLLNTTLNTQVTLGILQKVVIGIFLSDSLFLLLELWLILVTWLIVFWIIDEPAISVILGYSATLSYHLEFGQENALVLEAFSPVEQQQLVFLNFNRDTWKKGAIYLALWTSSSIFSEERWIFKPSILKSWSSSEDPESLSDPESNISTIIYEQRRFWAYDEEIQVSVQSRADGMYPINKKE